MEISVEKVPSGRYKAVTQTKARGATYTPEILADFVAQQICQLTEDLSACDSLRILDPAIGDGELLMSLLGQLDQQNIRAIEVYGFETDIQALKIAITRIQQSFPKAKLYLEHDSFLDFVLTKTVKPSFDIIIANPPYVRTQIMGAERAQLLANQFGLHGRIDLYHAFIIGMGQVLKPGGIGGIIVSNRFMTTKSGGAIRQAIREKFTVQHVWDLGDTKLFDAAILPAVLLLKRQDEAQKTIASFTAIYATTNGKPRQQARHALDALNYDGGVEIDDGRTFHVTHGQLDLRTDKGAVWRIATAKGDNWLRAVDAHTWKRFGDIGKIRVGVKTCADKVFIRNDWDSIPQLIRPELLRPLTTHHIARRFRANSVERKQYILYPHESVEGKRCTSNLASYPNAKAYLEQHRADLEKRTYVIESGRQWYEIWVPQNPASWSAPKLVFRDISEIPTFWLDFEGTVINGDCYWLVNEKSEDTELLWLAVAVANSTFIEAFYDQSFNNKLYAGRRRFITQYVERFPLPNPALPHSRMIVALAQQIYESVDSNKEAVIAAELDRLVWEAFGVIPQKI